MLSRSIVAFTRQQLASHPDLVAALDAALAGPSLARPPDAAGRWATDYLRVTLAAEQLDALILALEQIEGTRATARPDEVHLSFAPTLLDVWVAFRHAGQSASGS